MPILEENIEDLNFKISNMELLYQQKIEIKKGYPSSSEMKENELIFRYLPGQGLYQFIKFNGQVYNNKFAESARPAVNKLIDSTSGTASDRVDTSISNTSTDDISTLTAKVNEIIGKL